MISRRLACFRSILCLHIQELARAFQFLDADSIFEEDFTSQQDEELGTVTGFFVSALRTEITFSSQ
jgi:hypothetical protein